MFEIAVLIAATKLQPALKARVSAEVRTLLVFDESAALPALQAITSRKPQLVVLERAFADTPRGKALMNRLKADPALASITLRQLAGDETSGEAAPAPAAAEPSPAPAAADAPPVTPPAHLDFSGTRRAERHAIDGASEVMVDGKPGTLINLSIVGAQFVTATALRPTQRVRLAFSDEAGTIRCTAVVVWANFEMPKGAGPRYRVGVDFVSPNAQALEGYITRRVASRS